MIANRTTTICARRPPVLSPKQVIAVGVNINVGSTASDKETVTSSVQDVTVSVIVIVYSPEGTPENTSPVILIDAGLGKILYV